MMINYFCSLTVYIGEDTPEEPDFQYIPDTHHAPLPPGGDPLSGSMALLQETLENGNLLAQFEVCTGV